MSKKVSSWMWGRKKIFINFEIFHHYREMRDKFQFNRIESLLTCKKLFRHWPHGMVLKFHSAPLTRFLRGSKVDVCISFIHWTCSAQMISNLDCRWQILYTLSIPSLVRIDGAIWFLPNFYCWIIFLSFSISRRQ